MRLAKLFALFAMGSIVVPAAAPAASADDGIHKIKHVIIITQENRSFDSYFGTFPGANGIPMKNGVPSVCVPDPINKRCAKPYVDHMDSNYGGPHGAISAQIDIDKGKMDGFIAALEHRNPNVRDMTDEDDADPNAPSPPYLAAAARSKYLAPDVMGYHDGTDLPNYWSLAQQYVLQDNFFQPLASWSLLSHLALFSTWAAWCSNPGNPNSCESFLKHYIITRGRGNQRPYAWTDLTWLLHANNVSWACYLDGGTNVPVYWNVLPGFSDLYEDNQHGNVQDLSKFDRALSNGTLPAVSWILPYYPDSEHPNFGVAQGQAYVSSIVNAVMASPEWSSTAIFIWWDDWGGFYDHVVPPVTHGETLGLRVPSLVISPYVKHGTIDHQVMSPDVYIKFIEDDFLGGQRLDPKTDGRPDSRGYAREANPIYGDLRNDFDFKQKPAAPKFLRLPLRSSLISNAR